MDRKLFDELKACFEFLNTDKNSRAIVLTGAGKCFTAGIDVKYLSSSAVSELGEIDDVARKAMHLRRMIQRTQASLRAVDKCEKPVIAAIHGHCVGAGVDLSACCDIRYGTRDATFSIKEVDMGLAADVGTLQILPKYISDHGLFRELVFSSRTFNIDEAQKIGLISRVFENRETLLQAAIALAETIAQKSPIATQGSKINLNYARDHTTDDNFNFVSTWNSGMMLGEDILKSIMASTVSKGKSDDGKSGNDVKFDDV